MKKHFKISKVCDGVLSEISKACSKYFTFVFNNDTLERAFLKPLKPHSEIVYRRV
jgi:hypothetical protein